MDLTPVWISLKTTLTATVITFFVGVLVARWRISYRGKLGGLIDSVMMIPLALPPTVVGLFLLMVFGRSSFIGQMLFPYTIVFSWTATVIAAVVVSFPLMYLTAKAAFQHIDSTLIDLARVYGFSEWHILWRVMLPLGWHGLAAGAVLSFVRALGEFGATLMIAGNIPGQTQTMPIAIFFAVEGGERNLAIILAFINLLIAIVAIVVMNFLEKRR
jgi:molybdate transport system permease protein